MQSPSTSVLALIQMSMVPEPSANLQKALDWCHKAVRQGAHVICLPELFSSRYFCQKEDADRFNLAVSAESNAFSDFLQFANKHQVVLFIPFFEKRSPGIYHNSVLVVDSNGTICGIYRKMHIPDDPAYYEKYYFAPGDTGFCAFNTRYGTIAPLICWDQWYPEAARIAALHGAMLLVYPTAIGWHPYEKERYGARQFEAWMTVQRGHAIANGVYVGAANRVGFEPEEGQAGIQFWGGSFICDPQGVILAQAGHDEEALIVAAIDLEQVETIRRNWPFFRDRRIDAYAEITRRFLD